MTGKIKKLKVSRFEINVSRLLLKQSRIHFPLVDGVFLCVEAHADLHYTAAIGEIRFSIAAGMDLVEGMLCVVCSITRSSLFFLQSYAKSLV